MKFSPESHVSFWDLLTFHLVLSWALAVLCVWCLLAHVSILAHKKCKKCSADKLTQDSNLCHVYIGMLMLAMYHRLFVEGMLKSGSAYRNTSSLQQSILDYIMIMLLLSPGWLVNIMALANWDPDKLIATSMADDSFCLLHKLIWLEVNRPSEKRTILDLCSCLLLFNLSLYCICI